jgi:predicted DNA-binding ribbon-helix-helix protein
MPPRIVVDTNVFIAAFPRSTLTIRLSDDKHARLRQLAKHRDISVNKLIEEFATISIAEFDTETRFRSLAAQGNATTGLELLDKLDAALARKPPPRKPGNQ